MVDAKATETLGGSKTKDKQPNVRKVNGFLIYMDEVLGSGQYGKVVKA